MSLAIIGIILALALAATSEDRSSSKNHASGGIKLQEPRVDGGISLDKALAERRSIRSFGNEGLSFDEVSQILWAAQGVTDEKGHRTAPSALARYPLEVYLVAGNVTGLPSGVYRFSPQEHGLTVTVQGNVDDYYDASAGFEDWIKTAPAIFIITGALDEFNRIGNHSPGSAAPGKDMSRWVYVEAGAAAENLLLEVVGLNLAATYTAGFNESKIEELLGLPENEVPIGVIPVGRKA